MDCLRSKALQDLQKLSSVTVLNTFWFSLCYFAVLAFKRLWAACCLLSCTLSIYTCCSHLGPSEQCPGFSCCFSFSCAHPVSERSIAEGRSTELLAGTSLLSVAPFCSPIQRSLWFVLTQETLVSRTGILVVLELFHSKKHFFHFFLGNEGWALFEFFSSLCTSYAAGFAMGLGDNFGAVFPSLYIHFVVRSWVGKCLRSAPPF